jgi:hypothetical protein
MKTLTTVGLALGLVIGPAHATMDLIPSPKSITVQACQKWAAEQDEDAFEMWGLQDSGKSSHTVAVKRLIDSCMGRPVPEIVGFWSGVGNANAYCKKHMATKLCKDYKK